jgi:hypothetical protein
MNQDLEDDAEDIATCRGCEETLGQCICGPACGYWRSPTQRCPSCGGLHVSLPHSVDTIDVSDRIHLVTR